jgi:hypothetical protein
MELALMLWRGRLHMNHGRGKELTTSLLVAGVVGGLGFLVTAFAARGASQRLQCSASTDEAVRLEMGTRFRQLT